MMDASNRANSWANQRKEAVDKAKRLREERKFNLAMAGGMSVANNEMTTNNIGRITSSENQYREFQKPLMNDYLGQRKPATMKYGMSMLDQQPSDEELMQARSSLRLLKSKMKESNGFPNPPMNNQRGYYEEETHEYLPNAPGNKQLGHDNNLNDVYQNGNQNYRKVFKPAFGNDEYQKKSNLINNQINQIDNTLATRNRTLNRANNNGPPPIEEYKPHFGNSQQPRSRVTGKPPVGDKYSFGNDQPQNDYPDFSSKNIPSRIPKNTLTPSKEKPHHNNMNSNYGGGDDYGLVLPNRQPYKSPMNNESPAARKGYNDYTLDEQPKLGSVPQKNNRMQEQSFGSAQKNQNKGWQAAKNPYDDPEPEDTKAFSKPSFKKKTTPAPSKPTQKTVTYEDNEPPIKSLNAQNKNNEPEEYGDEGPLEECPVGCGRKFNPDVLEKHAKICKKVFMSKRKKFDSAGQRATDEAVEVANENKYNGYYPPKGKANPKQAGKPGGDKKAKWKAESEAFRANLKAARGGTLSKEEQNAVTQASQDNLFPCPHCGRKFSEQASKRHVPFCATKQKAEGIKKGGKGR